jgi:hypothetical protein
MVTLCGCMSLRVKRSNPAYFLDCFGALAMSPLRNIASDGASQ